MQLGVFDKRQTIAKPTYSGVSDFLNREDRKEVLILSLESVLKFVLTADER